MASGRAIGSSIRMKPMRRAHTSKCLTKVSLPFMAIPTVRQI